MSVRNWMTYHKWLTIYFERVERKEPGVSPSTDDIVEAMSKYFGVKRSTAMDIIGAWDGSAESIGEVE